MPKMNIDDNLLDFVTGGSIGYNPDGNGTYTMNCQYSGNSYQGVTLTQVMQIAQYSARIPNTPEGEQQIIQWATENNIIH